MNSFMSKTYLIIFFTIKSCFKFTFSDTMPLGKGFEGCIYRMQVQNIFPLKRVFQDPRPSYITLTPKGKFLWFCLFYLLAHFSDVCKLGWRMCCLKPWFFPDIFSFVIFCSEPSLGIPPFLFLFISVNMMLNDCTQNFTCLGA